MVAGVSITALVVAASFAPGASGASRAPGASHASTSNVATFHPTKLRTCFDQSDNDNGVGIVSQNFESSFDQYDSRGADDFKLKRTCQVKMIMVYGTYFNGAGPAVSENVTFYRDMAGVPGGVISNQQNLVGQDDGLGNFSIDLHSAVGLRAGKYWVSVQANMDFAVGGEWGWNTNNKQRGNPGVWRNKGDGFATGCIHYTELTTCIPSGEGPDYALMVHGS